jgi:hypothetical protein
MSLRVEAVGGGGEEAFVCMLWMYCRDKTGRVYSIINRRQPSKRQEVYNSINMPGL